MAKKNESFLKKKTKRLIKRKALLWIGGVLGSTVGIFMLLAIVFIVLISSIFGAVVNYEEEQSQVVDLNTGCAAGDIDEKNIVKVFNSKAKGGALENKGEHILKISNENKVPVHLSMSIVALESGWGKGNNALHNRNPYSIMGNGPLQTFNTIEEGIEVGIKNLYKNYIKLGLDTPEEIGPKYAPVGASNDPTGLNNNWIPQVNNIIKNLGVSVECSSSTLAEGDIGSPVDVPLLARVTCKIGDYPGHPGIDIGLPIGTPIYAMTDGKVTKSVGHFVGGGPTSSYFGKDNFVQIKVKGTNLFASYRHLKPGGNLVKVGDEVKAGQKIGLSGNTGFSTGPHLHVEVAEDAIYKVSYAKDWYTPLKKKHNIKEIGWGCNV